MARKKGEIQQDGLIIIGNRLSELRKEARLTQADLAAKLGVDLKTYRSWETCKREPPLGAVQELAHFYQVSIDYIVGGGFRAVNGEAIQALTGLTDAAIATLIRNRNNPPGTAPDRANCSVAFMVSDLLKDYEGQGPNSVLKLLRSYTTAQPNVEGWLSPSTGRPVPDFRYGIPVNLSAAILLQVNEAIQKFRDRLQKVSK